ncbi:MAG TPA: hypothetical protein VNT03_05845, partial [Baekduia sp.]|nr:hypothetical protein [Baekduia sp.]
ELAAAYRDARRALPSPADLAAARPAPALHGTLTAIEGAYRRLSRAAARSDPAAFRDATRDVVAGERRLGSTLHRVAGRA